MEASLYTKLEDNKVSCHLCAHRCTISPGKRGVCGVRENRDGMLATLTYGRLISRAVDPIEKKPMYHFLPGTASYSIATAGCNFRCDFCQNWSISQLRPRDGERRDLPGADATPEDVAGDAERTGCATIAYTYTEPTIFFEFARDCARLAHEKCIANVFVTNGYQTPETIEVMTGLIDAANVDLKSFSDDFYRERCGARLEPVLDAIRRMHAAGIFIEVTTLLIPGLNDSEDELRKLTEFLAGLSPDVPWHVSRFHPDYKLTEADSTPGASLERAVETGRKAGLRYVYVGNAPTEHTDTVCPHCRTTVIGRRGFSAKIVSLGRPLGKGSACGSCGAELPIVRRAVG
jgi:pyruvate formate lyase activating enzyme